MLQSQGIHARVTQLKGVGPAIQQKLNRLGISSLLDLLLHLPYRYQDRTRLVALRSLSPNQECLVSGEIVEARLTYGRRRSLLVTLKDDTGFLVLRFFHFSRVQQNQLKPGVRLRCFGEARFGPKGLEMVHPEYRIYTESVPAPEKYLTPIYPTSEGLGQARLRKLVAQALEAVGEWNVPTLAEQYLPENCLTHMPQALRILHTPPADVTQNKLSQARNRIAFDELVAHFLVLKRRQLSLKSKTTLALPQAHRLGKMLLHRLGFQLTRAQRRVTTEILTDLSSARPMLRLLQGDVGSGKTIIAAFAAIRAAENEAQTAIMAPTEILAEQHYENFSDWLSPLGISVVLLTGKLGEKERKLRLGTIEGGDATVVVGTHALFQKEVSFHRLGLVVIDEQHRFGVHQRLSLTSKGYLPHQLVMTATPIPRTLTMSMYADMDVSVLDELPPGRQPITTTVVSDNRRQEIIRHLAQACAEGKQAYWVCTLIEESEILGFRAAESVHAELSAALPDLSIGLVHGRLQTRDKASVMADFKAGRYQLLVATTVIEVGVDVPNATLIVIENPERLGLAQLHQLRGRVGRGSEPSHCVLLYGSPLGQTGRERLNVMRETTDGFLIAEADLKLRGPGDLLGTRQTGELNFKVADLMLDAAMLSAAKSAAESLLDRSSGLEQTLYATWSPAEGDYSGV